jgi:serine/threonine protein phosphatase PrpC
MGDRGAGFNQAGIVSSNAGYSGTPLWKLKQQGALPKIQSQDDVIDESKQEEVLLAQHVPLVQVDAVSLGQVDDGRRKPLVRHVLVKDLRKVAARSKVSLPATGLLENRAPMSLFALFDGQSCAGEAGPLAAEYCANQVLGKLLRNISALPPGYVNQTFIKATLLKTFEDLDKEILQTQTAIHDGCGAAVALCVGEFLFTAVAGNCNVTLVEAGPPGSRGESAFIANNMGVNQGLHNTEDRKFTEDNGGQVVEGDGGKLFIQSPAGVFSPVARTLGDRAWKGPLGGVPGSLKLVRFNPDNRVTELSWAEKHIAIMLGSAPVNEVVSSQEMAKLAGEFRNKPRAVSGEIAEKAMQACPNGMEQCTSVTIYFLPPTKDEAEKPASKKPRIDDTLSKVRVRHILVKHKDCGQPFDPVRSRPVMRTRGEAETMLRRALKELTQEAKTMKLPADKSKAQAVALQPTPKYLVLCKEMSECTTAQKGGGMCGDLGWLGQDQLRGFGPAFSEMAKALQVGQWSDLASSDHGIHLLQRIA